MNSRYFVNLAIQNIIKHRQAYVPYILNLIVFVAMFYLLLYLADSVKPILKQGEDIFNYLLRGASYLFGAFAVFFLIYSNNFLVRPRTKEYGLFYVFGMSQRHMLLIMTYEFVFVFVGSIIGGMISGILLSRLMSMIFEAIVQSPMESLYLISVSGLITTAWLFFSIMAIILVINVVQIIRAKPVAMLHQSDTHESIGWKQLVLLFIGVICIAYSYMINLFIDSPQQAYAYLASIIIATVIGTYCLFVSFSVFVLHFLSRRPAFYYQTQNFITINGLLQRVRFNAIGLASVSMFSFIMLIIVTLTGIIYFGIDESTENLYVADIVLTFDSANLSAKSDLHALVDETVQSQSVTSELVDPYEFLSLGAYSRGSIFQYELQNRTLVGDSNSHLILLITAGQYYDLYGEYIALTPQQVAVYSSYTQLPDSFVLAGESYEVIRRLPKVSIANYDLEQLLNAHYIVVHDRSVLEYHSQQKSAMDARFPGILRYRFGININGSAAQKMAVADALEQAFQSTPIITQSTGNPESKVDVWFIQSRQSEKIVFQIVYGTLYFLGLFIGVLFVMSTAVLIYYKQLSEGYEDKQRFDIMQRIGMTRSEVRANVDRQIVYFFLIPLFVAGSHFLVSLNWIHHLIGLFRLANIELLLSVSMMTLMVFSVVYVVIYRLSARVYYNIVR
jgi:putative ABC transport system permease protein